jgi:hypothetical protein
LTQPGWRARIWPALGTGQKKYIGSACLFFCSPFHRHGDDVVFVDGHQDRTETLLGEFFELAFPTRPARRPRLRGTVV